MTALLTMKTPRIVKLTPPMLIPQAIGGSYVSTRPMREEKINISLQAFLGDSTEKTIVNCYGHGGSGFTTLFGAVSQALHLFKEINPSKKAPIRIVGAGCIGLTMAIELYRQGYNVTGITAKNLYDIPSWKTAGYFALVSVKTSVAEQQHMHEMGVETFQTYQAIECGEHPYLSRHTVRYMPVYTSMEAESGVEDLELRELIPPREEVELDFGNGVVHKKYFKFMTFFINTTTLMQQLHREVEKYNIPIRVNQLHDFSQIQEPYIFCCAGLGARELLNDNKMIPVRGHLVALNAMAGQEHMNYMVYTKVKQNNSNESIYMFPKNLCVSSQYPQGISCNSILGGTFIQNTDHLSPEELQKFDEAEIAKLLNRNSEFFHGKPFSLECGD